MALLDRLLGRSSSSSPPVILTPRETVVGSWPEWWETIRADISSSSPARLFRSQPHLRTVVSFRARNIAQLGLHVFERVDESDRRRDRTSVVARALRAVDGVMTPYEMIFALVGDLDLYDRAHWLVVESADLPSGWMIRRLPPSWVTPEEHTAFEVLSWRISHGKQSVVVPADRVLSFTGYSPTDPRTGSPTVESLRETLAEQIEAAVYRKQVWKRGGRVSAVLQRPMGAPEWSDAARETFREDWYAKFTGRGPNAGGTPILEDGMTLQRIDFTAQEQQFVEAAKLSLTTVAAAYHVNPTMIGQNDGANYSNVREFRKMLYGDTLGPLVAQIESRLNAFLLPMLGVDPDRFYVEFNIEEKLQGNFEEQAVALQAATGAPWMTRNEARALRNLPAVDGGDELITPLNVLVGGQASPLDSGEQNRRSATPRIAGARVRVKTGADEEDVDELSRVLIRFARRQRDVVLSHLGAKADVSWWDDERWNRELGDDLYAAFVALSSTLGRRAILAAGGSVRSFDVTRLTKYLQVKAEAMAVEINATTLEQLEAALDDPEGDVAHVFDVAEESRWPAIAMTTATTLAGFATVEAAKQTGGARKTWHVNSGNPRPSHAVMDGETVPIQEEFSNGMRWPGDSTDADEVAGCTCSVDFIYPD